MRKIQVVLLVLALLIIFSIIGIFVLALFMSSSKTCEFQCQRSKDFVYSKPLNGLYINLAHRKDRDKEIKDQLETIKDLQMQRFEAVLDKTHGGVGCSKSHIGCLELAKKKQWPMVFIFEDDFVWKESPQKAWSNIVRALEHLYSKNIKWKVLLLAGGNVNLGKSIGCGVCSVKSSQQTAGYLVKDEFYDVLLENFTKGVQSLKKNPDKYETFALDQYWKRLQKGGGWYCIQPWVGQQRASYSDIEKKKVKYN